MRRRKRDHGVGEVGGGEGPEGELPAHFPGQEVQNARDEEQAHEREEGRHHGRYQGPATQTAKGMNQLWIGMLVIVLTGGMRQQP